MPSSVVIPMLAYPDVREAVRWLVRTFGFEERLRIDDHRAQLVFMGQAVVVIKGPAPHDGVWISHSVMVRVPDVDAHFRRVEAAGARGPSVPETYPYGERQYSVRDIGGHLWTFTESVQDVDPTMWGGMLYPPDD